MKIGIVGLGLIGGSIAKSIKKNTSHLCLGYDIDKAAAELYNAFNAALGK